MALLLGVGFLAGVLTAISPCVLPVLPILLAGGAAGGRRRPYAIVAGLGASLGLVFVPCAGPIFAYVAVRAASESLNAKAVLLTIAYSLGAAVPMLLVALGGRELALRFRAASLRPALGVAITLAGVAIVFHADTRAQTALGGYTNRLQDWIEGNDAVTRRLHGQDGSAALAAFGRAPDFHRISHWLNTPGARPLTLAGLRGRVILVD